MNPDEPRVPAGEVALQERETRLRRGERRLHQGEVLREAEGVPQIVYFRPGAPGQPLAVFLPGGGHLARVAYGHPGAHQRDFIDAWLAEEGYGLLALSYPSDHPAFKVRCVDLSIPRWAASIASLVADHVRGHIGREIVVMGWSMAGRAVVAVARALRALGLHQLCFVSLAATAPLPYVLPPRASPERFTDEGFWDSSTRHGQWLEQLRTQLGASGKPAITREDYFAHYVVNTPFTLRGPRQDGAADAASLNLPYEIGAFAYEDYPLVASIVPEGKDDRLHALADRATWGALNVLRIVRRLPGRSVATAPLRAGASGEAWSALRELLRHVPERLSRAIPGGHFFFIGEPGARATVQAMVALAHEARELDTELQHLEVETYGVVPEEKHHGQSEAQGENAPGRRGHPDSQQSPLAEPGREAR